MPGMFRSVLALFTLGMTTLRCNRSTSPAPSGDGAAPFQAAFRVPAMT